METTKDREIIAPHILNWESRRDFNRQYRPCGQEGRYIVDFSHTIQIDAVGIGLLLQLSQALGDERERLYLARAQGSVLDVIRACGLERVAHIGYPHGGA